MFRILRKHWKLVFFLAALILPLGFLLGPIALKYWYSREARKKARLLDEM